jgi:hypothetical protein
LTGRVPVLLLPTVQGTIADKLSELEIRKARVAGEMRRLAHLPAYELRDAGDDRLLRIFTASYTATERRRLAQIIVDRRHAEAIFYRVPYPWRFDRDWLAERRRGARIRPRQR